MSDKLAPGEVRNILIVDSMPSPSERQDYTVYVVKDQGKPERDRYLGAFMDRWSELEAKSLLLLWRLLDVRYPTAEAIFYSTTNVRTPLDIIGTLIVTKHPDSGKEWRRLRGTYLDLSTNRNHLVHGRWRREVSIALESPTRPIVAKVDWVRLYMTGDLT